MNARTLIGSATVTLALAALTAWLFQISFMRAALLAPVIVVAAGALAGLVVLWTKIGLESLRRRRRPRLVLAVALGVVGLIFVLSILGLELPREGG